MILNRVFQLLYLSWIVTEVLVLVATRTRPGGGDSRGGQISDRGSLVVLWVVIFSSITAGMWLGAAYRPAAIHAGPSTGAWLAYLTVALMAVGLGLRWAAIYTLGRSFSANVAIHATQTLNRSGVFRSMRHPSYTGMVLIFFGMGLSTRNWLGLALIVLPPVAALLYRIHVEEAALTGAFGQEYVEYSRTTKRLIPGIY
jgi:protein-S-isoprenylcysteine O-methyltransferase Ste14